MAELLAEGSKRDVVRHEALGSVEVRWPEQATLTPGDYSKAVDSGTYT